MAWHPVRGGYTPAFRARAVRADGSSAFVKAATSDETAAWLRTEHQVYHAVTGDFLPAFLGWDDSGPRPVLVLEDLSQAHWPPPWQDGDVERLVDALGRVARAMPPPGLPRLQDGDAAFQGWAVVAEDPAPFLSLGLVEPKWLDTHLPVLIEASARAPLAGDQLVHLDTRSDNVCFDGDRTVLVDWNWASIGNPDVGTAFWLASLDYEGGGVPEVVLPDAPAHAAMVSGFMASRAGLPPPSPGSRVREVQRRQLETALAWTVRALELPPPRR